MDSPQLADYLTRLVLAAEDVEDPVTISAGYEENSFLAHSDDGEVFVVTVAQIKDRA